MKKFKYNPYFPYFHRLKSHLLGKRHHFKDLILSSTEDYLQYLDSLNENLERSERKAKMSRLLGKQVSISNYRTFVKTGLLPFTDTELLDAYFIHKIKSSGYSSTDNYSDNYSNKKYYPSLARNLLLTVEHLEFFFEVLANSHEELTKTWKMRDEIVTDKIAKDCKKAALWLKEKLKAVSSVEAVEAVQLWIDGVIEREGFDEEVFLEDYETDYVAVMPVMPVAAMV